MYRDTIIILSLTCSGYGEAYDSVVTAFSTDYNAQRHRKLLCPVDLLPKTKLEIFSPGKTGEWSDGQYVGAHLSTVDETVFPGHSVGYHLAVGTAGSRHANSKLIGVMFGVGPRSGQQSQRGQQHVRSETVRPFGSAAWSVRRHRYAVCYWWRSRVAGVVSRLFPWSSSSWQSSRAMRAREGGRLHPGVTRASVSTAVTHQTFISGRITRARRRR